MDWMAQPEGDRALSAEYFKKAGMASGKYEGDEELLIVGDGAEPDKSISQITEQQLNEMGFKTKLRLVDARHDVHEVLQRAEVRGQRLPERRAGSRTSPDPQTMLDPTFNGENILQVGNNQLVPSSTCPRSTTRSTRPSS